MVTCQTLPAVSVGVLIHDYWSAVGGLGVSANSGNGVDSVSGAGGQRGRVSCGCCRKGVADDSAGNGTFGVADG